MRFTKPAWVVHHEQGTKGDQVKRNSIFSVHVHPDGSRIATGGLDARIRIWSTKPILDQASELSNRPPKSLCTLTMHTGPVLTVRWAHSGRWLASGSDDEIVMVWDLDPNGAGKVWGTDEVNVEGWKPLKRLPGHESDVTDVSWAPEDRYLASVGLDSKVIIWCGYTLERLRKLDQHQGFVKGVCWDPVGEFLATQSDDKTVKIWRTTDWGLEAEVAKPFEDSPGSTFFRRLSWSPDGAHITASNAMNNNGFVFVAAVIARNIWTSDISLVGHENTVEVAAYNPNIFLRNPSMPVVTANICSVVALGADDRSISVWQTKSARPVIVAKEVFERQILDLSWSWDGLTLYAVSSDGTMAVLNFDPHELEGIAPRDVQAKYLQKFGFVPPPLPIGYQHVSMNYQAPDPIAARRTTPPPTPPPSSSQLHHSFSGTTGAGSGEHVNVLVAKRGNKNKKRVQPTFMGTLGAANGHVSSAATTPPFQVTSSTLHSSNVPTSSLLGDGLNGSMTNIKLPPPPMQSVSRSMPAPQSSSRPPSAYAPPLLDLTMDNDMDERRGSMDMDVPINSLDTSNNNMKGKRRASDFAFNEDGQSFRVPKPRTLGGDRVREAPTGVPSEIRQVNVVALVRNSSSDDGILLTVPSLKTYLAARVEDSSDLLEATNPTDNSRPSEVQFSLNKDIQWLDYLPSPVLNIAVSPRFSAVAMEDGSLSVYSRTGRRLMPTMCLGSPCSFLDASKNFLLALTASGRLHVWNVKSQQTAFPPTSIAYLLTPNLSILSATVRPNGAPLLQFSNGTAFSFDSSLQTFVKVSDAWWAQGSSHWKGRQRSNNSASESRGIVSAIEGRITEWIGDESGAGADTPRPSWWNAALTLGHLETRLHAARVLESPLEYKQTLLLYAKSIADEGFRGKAEELLKELYGPVYWRHGRTDEGWSPTVLGLAKRDLAKDVIAVFARSKTMYKVASDYSDLLKKSSADD